MPDNPPPAPAAPPARRRLLWPASLAAVLVILVAGGLWALTRSASSGHTSLARTSLTPSSLPTPTAAPHVVYTADWSHGADGWVLPPSVHVTSGHLVFTGAGDDVNLTIPYQPPVTGYTVEIKMEIIAVSPASHGGTVTIAGQDTSGSAQYYAQLLCLGKVLPGCNGGQTSIGTKGGVYPIGQGVSDFSVGQFETRYTIQVAGSNVQFCNGGGCQSAAFVKVPTAPLKLVLQDSYLQIVVTSVEISIP